MEENFSIEARPPKVVQYLWVPLSVFLHHILRLWPRKQWSVRSDFMYSTAELSFVTGYLITEIIVIRGYGYDPFNIMAFISSPLLWLSITAAFLVTIWDLCASQYRMTRSTYDFRGNYDDMVIGWRKSKIGPWSLLFGENICRRRFGIDRVFVRGLRGGISILCLFERIALGYLVLIVQPKQQQPYFQTMQTTDYSKYEYGNVTMRVHLAWVTWSANPSESVDLDIARRPEGEHVLCGNVNRTTTTCNVQSPFRPTSPDSFIVKINYTRALQHLSIPLLRTGVYLTFNSDGQEGDMSATPIPIHLYPGFHLFGTTFYSFRDTYTNSRDLELGIPRFDRHLIPDIRALIPDPEYMNSNLDNTTATLMLTYQGGVPNVQHAHELRKEKSSNMVVSGFAQLGGAWTFINGVFATVFGCRLLLVLFGIRPLSIYGLVHLFQPRRSLVDGGYTLSVEERSRTIAVLREHLLDGDDRDIEAGEVGEEKDRGEERRQLHDTVQ